MNKKQGLQRKSEGLLSDGSDGINSVEEVHIYLGAIRARPMKLRRWSSEFIGEKLWAKSSDPLF
jgi:hypothetical protein